MAPVTGFAIMFVACGLLMAALGIPLMQRRVKPNGLYGLRVRATFADEHVWYEANAQTGRDFVILGVAQLASAFLLLWPPISAEAYALTNVTILTAGALVVAIVGWRRANRLLDERRRNSM